MQSTIHPRSLLSRLTLRVSLVTLLMTVMTYAWVYYQIQLSADRVTESSLMSQTQQIVARIGVNAGSVVFQPPEDVFTAEDESDGDFRYAIYDGDGAVLFASTWPPTALAEMSSVEIGVLYGSEHNRPVAAAFIGTLRNLMVEGRTLVVQVERNNRDLEALIDTVLDEYFYHGAWLGLPFLLVLIGVIRWTIQGAIEPVQALSRQASGIGPLSTERRLEETDVPQEILPLVQAVNSALDRLDRGFRMQREFTGDVAHELRTPLAVLLAQIDTLEDQELAASLRVDVDLITRLVSQLLRAAQLDGVSIPSFETADLSDTARAVYALMRPIADREGKVLELECPGEPVAVRGNNETIFHALRNLVENAVRYSPASGTAQITVMPEGIIRVIDHGPGIEPTDLPHIFDRFWRKDKSGTGAGLGLSIVKKTMDLHKGRVEVSETLGGGTTVTLTFVKGLPEPEFATGPELHDR